jgi:dihydrofolate reductase
MEKQMKPADLLLGRKTFEIFADYWPEHENGWPGVNDATKYVMSKTMKKSDWKNSVFLKSLADIEKLKNLTFKFTAVVSSFSYYLRMI